MKPVTILEAIADRKLLGHGFKKRWLKGDSWAAWRSCLCAIFALAFESVVAFETYRACTGRSVAPTKQAKEVYLICGRRSGKSYLTAAIATYIAAFRDHAPYLSPGEVGVVAIVAADKSQAAIILRYIRGFIASSPILRSMLASDLKETITLKNGIEIQVLTADFRSVRGRTLCAALVDELAFLNASDGSANPDSAVLEALRPSLISIPDSILIGLSSPYAKRGELYRQFQLNYGKDESDVLIWKAASSTMNPSLSKLSIAAAFLRDPVSARTEYSAEFRDDLSGFLTQEVLDACIVRGRVSLPRLPSITYRAFADMSGGRSDSATLGIAHLDGEKGVLDLLIERPAPHVPQEVTAEFSRLLKSYGCHEVTADKYSAEWAASEFYSNGITLRPSDKNRSEIYLEFLPAVLSQQVELLDHPKMNSQLLGLERRVGRNQDQIDHGPGGHDDCANAAAGALVQVRGSGFWPVEMAHEALSARKDLQPLPSIEEEKAAIVAGGTGVRREPAKHDRRFGAQRINNVGTSAVIEKPTLSPTCPRCGNVGLARASVQGISGEIRESCPCGWSQVTPGRTGLRFH
jgi:terminase large subunit-like protein